MSLRPSLQRPLTAAAVLAVLAAPASAQQLTTAASVASNGAVGRLPAVERDRADRPAAAAPAAPAPAPARTRVAKELSARVSKELPGPVAEYTPVTVFEYMLTPSELAAPEIDPIAAAPFSMPTVGAGPGGGTRWLWILPLGLLPFLGGDGDEDRQPVENVLPTTPAAPPATPATPGTPESPTAPNPAPDQPPVVPPVVPPALLPDEPATTTAPEPGTFALLATGLAAVGVAARRRRR